MNSIETPRLTVPLGGEAHASARQFAAEQTTPQKGKKAYLNTLAVYAVHSYLKWLQIETNLSQSDSWHPLKRALFDIADLAFPGVGRLECRPVLPGETTFSLPLEVAQDRIGYVAVQFSEHLNEVQLLGFIRAVDISDATEQILIADLQPLDALLDYIPTNVVDEEPILTVSNIPVNLSHWLQNIFEGGWQTVEALFSTEAANPAFSVRSAELLRENHSKNSVASVSGGKLLDLGMLLAGHLVTLIVTIAPFSDEEVNIHLRVYPAGGQIYLPPSLQLVVLDQSRATCLKAQARNADNWMQLEFSGEPGERFSVKLALGDVNISEYFVI